MKLLPIAVLVACVWGSPQFSFEPAEQAVLSPPDVADESYVGAFNPGEPSKDLTIYELLKVHSVFSKLVKAIDYVDEIASVLKSPDSDITFFAVPNDALGSHPPHNDTFTPYENSLRTALEQIGHPDAATFDDAKRNLLKQIIYEVLSYHILPSKLNTVGLSANLTFPTALLPSDGSFAGQHRRIRMIGPAFHNKFGYVNFYSKIVFSNIEAKNGFIHVLSAPLFPPLSVLEQNFILPGLASVWTSTLQKTRTEDDVEYRIYPAFLDIVNKTTAPSVTAFVPTNDSWKKLPKDLSLFLFSPFGEKVLRKLIEFHIVPDRIAYSEFYYDASKEAKVNTGVTPLSSDAINAINRAEESIWTEMNHGLGGGLATQFSDASKLVYSRSMCSCAAKGTSKVTGTGLGESEDLSEAFSLKVNLLKQQMRLDKFKHSESYSKMPVNIINVPIPRAEDESVRSWWRGVGFQHFPPRPPPPHYPPGGIPKHPLPWHGKPISNETITLPTLFSNYTINFNVLKYKPHLISPNLAVKVSANGVPVIVSDIPARNGVYHIIPRILVPPHPKKDVDLDDGVDETVFTDEYREELEWLDWRDWLIKWAEEN